MSSNNLLIDLSFNCVFDFKSLVISIRKIVRCFKKFFLYKFKDINS